jgi:hypothetical protein
MPTFERRISKESLEELVKAQKAFNDRWDKVMERRAAEDHSREDERQMREHSMFVKNHFRRNR